MLQRSSLARSGFVLRAFCYAAVAATYLLIVIGAVVRATGSGLGCPDWPLCHGQLTPPSERSAVIEYSHRAIAGVTAGLAVAAVVLWVRQRGFSRRAVGSGAAIIGLLLAQVVLGGAAVALELPPGIVLVHLALAMLFLGSLTAMAVDVSRPFESALGASPRIDRDARVWRMALGAVVAVFALVLTGAYVRASGASWACAGFPSCNGEILPLGSGPLVDINLLHRLVAFVVAVHLVMTLLAAWRSQQATRTVRTAASAVAIFLIAQITVGVTLVSEGASQLAQVLHVAGAGGLWASTAALLTITVLGVGARELGTQDRDGTPIFNTRSLAPPPPGLAVAIRAYLSLTKPRIIGLLLLTTLSAMLMAQRGLPPWHLLLMTLIGGALGAAGANAMNCWLDRDIDALMARTASRAIPAGIISPARAAGFGVALAVASFAVLAVFVNLLAASLTLAAVGFYVLVYTRWLKRSSVHNIVIGGAAGAIPPVVGWAAVTGEMSPLALALFTLIFMWTPPHFWALALVVKGDYARAGVPMLPVVRGDKETRRQIVVYSVILAVLSVLLFAFGLLGSLYFVAALTLGMLLLAFAWRLLKEATDRAARRLFRYSIVYLALMFVFMVIDRQLSL